MRDSSVSALTAERVLSRFMRRAAERLSRATERQQGQRSVGHSSAERDSACANRGKSLLCPVFFGGSSKLDCRRQHINAKQPRISSKWPIPPKRASAPAKPKQRGKRNASLKSSLRTAIKKVRKAIAAGDKAAATKELQAQQSVIDRIADKKVVHKNTASRSKARLAQAIKALP